MHMTTVKKKELLPFPVPASQFPEDVSSVFDSGFDVASIYMTDIARKWAL